MYQREGNRAADSAAKLALAKCDVPRHVRDRTANTSLLVQQLGLYYGRLLAWLKRREFLPRAAPLEKRETVRVKRLPQHVIALDPSGRARCVKCLRLHGTAQQFGPCSAPRRSHILMRLGTGIFCNRCGAYSFARTFNLAAECTGGPSGNVARLRLRRMCRGDHPITGRYVSAATPVDPVQDFLVELGTDLPVLEEE